MKHCYIIFTLLLSVLSSCSKDNSISSTSKMSISSCKIIGRSSVETNLSSPIGLYLQTSDGGIYGDASYYATLSNESWSLNKPIYIDKSGVAYCFYPYVSSNLPNLAIDMSDQVDLLYSSSISFSPGSTALVVNLKHALSQLNVTVENEEIASLSLQSPLTANFDIVTGKFSNEVSGSVTSSSGTLYVIPNTYSKNLIVRLKSGEIFTYSVAGNSFASGEKNTYNFKLNSNREQLEFTSFTVDEWVSGSTYDDYI